MHSFAEFETVKAELLARCARLENSWADVRRFSSSTDAIAGDAEALDKSDVVQDAVGQIRQRLEASVLEVGVFGEVKRGKSTLLNALLGQEVSSMRATPETAVPVWVERGAGDATVIYVDGRVEEFDDPAEARERMTQRFRLRRPREPVSRVIQRVDVSWLPDGVRLVDTPGLADPSLAQDYEDLTLAELDRVAAAIFVFVSPPGIARDENRLLQSLADRGIEKSFMVCNFFPDHWANEEARDNVARTIRDTLQAGDHDDALVEDKVRVYEVNAKQALVAALRGDEVGVEEAGLSALRSDLERYLSEGAMRRLTIRCERLLDQAKATATSVLDHRINALSDQSSWRDAKERLSRELHDGREVLSRIESDALTSIASLRSRLEEIVTEPFSKADVLVASAERTRDLEGIAHRLRLASETSASRASTAFRHEVAVLEERMRRRLYESFGVDEALRTKSRSSELAPVSAGLDVGGVEGGVDVGSTAIGVGLGAATGALVGGSLAGGVGIALIAAGPVGWLIGAGLGLLAGGVVGGSAGAYVGRDSLSAQDRERLRSQIADGRGQARLAVQDLCVQLQQELVDSVTHQQDRFFGDRAAELRRVEEILEDSDRVASAVSDARDLRAQVGQV